MIDPPVSYRVPVTRLTNILEWFRVLDAVDRTYLLERLAVEDARLQADSKSQPEAGG